MTVYETNEPKLPARDGMVTAGNDGTGIFFQNTGDAFFNRIIAGVNIAGGDVEIADVSALQALHDIDLHNDVIRLHHGGNVTDVIRTEAGAGTEGAAGIKGSACNCKIQPPAESTFCILIKVPMLQNLGDDKALAGCLTSDISLSSLWIESDL